MIMVGMKTECIEIFIINNISKNKNIRESHGLLLKNVLSNVITLTCIINPS